MHDYLNQHGGAEKVVEVFAEMFPGAPIYTSVYDARCMPSRWRDFDIRTSFMQRLSPRMQVAKALFPLYPTAFESFDLREYDLVLSSSSAFAKGVLTRPHTCHVCYCHSPTRFLWMGPEYLAHERLPAAATWLLPCLATPLRVWDYAAAQRVDYFIAGSHNAARRIAKYYRRESDVVHPPVDTTAHQTSGPIGDYFLVVSRLQSYKRIDIAVEACSRLGVPLHVIGEGPDRARLEGLAGPTVRFYGRLADGEVRNQLSRARALIFPGEEDFGLAPLDAQAAGRPVIAFGGGGALESVRNGVTGVFFRPQSVESLTRVLVEFDGRFEPETIREHARSFDKQIFIARMYELLTQHVTEHQSRFSPPVS